MFVVFKICFIFYQSYNILRRPFSVVYLFSFYRYRYIVHLCTAYYCTSEQINKLPYLLGWSNKVSIAIKIPFKHLHDQYTYIRYIDEEEEEKEEESEEEVHIYIHTTHTSLVLPHPPPVHTHPYDFNSSYLPSPTTLAHNFHIHSLIHTLLHHP